MNKTTTLVLAAIAGFGLCAQANTTSTNLWGVNFDDGIDIPSGSATNFVDVYQTLPRTEGSWTVEEDDETCVTNGVGFSGSPSNLLELNTQGNDLTWKPAATNGTDKCRSIVETDIRFVGADDAPDGFDTNSTAQTALYLKNHYDSEDSGDLDGYELYAWTTYTGDEEGTNCWQLIGSFGPSFATDNGGWHRVRIVIDYRKDSPSLDVTLDGTNELTKANQPTAANAGKTKGKKAVTSVSFRGTGAIDNFVGSRLVTDFEDFDFTALVYKDGALDATVTGSSSMVSHAYAGDEDSADPVYKDKEGYDFKATFAHLPLGNFDFTDFPNVKVDWVFSSVVITNFETGAETTYKYNYNTNDLSFTPDEYECPAFTNLNDGTFTLFPSTYGATTNSLIAKVYYRTLGAYSASAVVNVGDDHVTYEQFVKPSGVVTTNSWTFPSTTNSTYVLSSVVVDNGATFDSNTGVVSYEVPAAGIGSDKTYATVTYSTVEGYDVYGSDGFEWVPGSGGTNTLRRKTFTVTWKNGEETLATTNGVAFGDVPEYYGAEPTKASTAQYDYAFTNWSPVVVAATANATYTALFSETVRSYDITWVAAGNDDQVTSVAYGGTPVAPADPTAPEGKVFDGWSTDGSTVLETLPDVTGAAIYIAVFVDDRPDVATLIKIAGGTPTNYKSVEEAIAAASAGDTVKLLADCNTGIGINAGTNIVLDLGGYTLSNPSDCPIWPMSGTLVVSNGTIRTSIPGSSYAAVYVSGGDLTLGDGLVVDATVLGANGAQGGFGVTVAQGGTVTVDGATINAREMCVFVASQGGATVNVVDGTLTSTDNAVVGGYGTTGWGGNTINVSGGTLNASIVSEGYAACGIYAPNNDTVNVSGGTINVTGGAGIVARAGEVNVTGGTITTTGSTTGKVGDSRVVVPCAAVVFDSQAAYPGYDSSSASVVIDGGTFVSDVTTVQQVGDDEIVSIPSTSTAVFSDADAEGVEDGYALKETEPGSGLYTVAKTYVVTYANYDGAALQVTTNFVNDATPAYAGETPAKTSDSQYDYTFTGWSPLVAATVTEDATYVAQFSAKENGTVIVITENGATTNYFATLQAALDSVKENNLQQANIELLADASITISRNGNVLGGNSTTNITINGNNHELHVVRDGTWAQFNTANDATLVLNDVSLTSEFTGTQTGWVGDTLQNPNHNIAFNCDVELNDVTSTTALSFWKDADLDTVTIAETVDVYSIWIHTTASNIAIKDLVVNSPNGRGIKVDDSFVKYAGTPSASTAISINGASFTTKNRKSAVLVRSAYPIAITTAGTIDISNVPADTQHLVWVDEAASEDFGLVTLDGGQSDLGVEGGTTSYAASFSENGTWIDGYYTTLADAVEIADADDTVTLLKDNAETFTVSKALTITRNGFSAANVTAGAGYQRTDTAEAYVFAEESQDEGHIGAKSDEGFVILASEDDDYTKPLTFAAPDFTAGTVAISASMIAPDSGTTATLTLLYKTDLSAGTYSTAQVTVKDIDATAGTATVELPANLGDTVFFFGFRNEAGVVDEP